jgi:hypothetical protein
MPEPDIDFLATGFDAVAVGVQFAAGLVSEVVLQDVCDSGVCLQLLSSGILSPIQLRLLHGIYLIGAAGI